MIIALYTYYEETDEFLTHGDLYIVQHGGINFNLPIMLISLSVQYNSFFNGGDINDFIGTLCFTYYILMYYARPLVLVSDEHIQ
jgi:hypothetical protein